MLNCKLAQAICAEALRPNRSDDADLLSCRNRSGQKLRMGPNVGVKPQITAQRLFVGLNELLEGRPLKVGTLAEERHIVLKENKWLIWPSLIFLDSKGINI